MPTFPSARVDIVDTLGSGIRVLDVGAMFRGLEQADAHAYERARYACCQMWMFWSNLTAGSRSGDSRSGVSTLGLPVHMHANDTYVRAYTRADAFLMDSNAMIQI